MFHSGVSSYVDNDNTRNTHHARNGRDTDAGNDEGAYFNPTETSLQLDTHRLAGVGLGPCLRRRAGGLGQSTAPLRPADLVAGEEDDVDCVDLACSADRRDWSDDPEVLLYGRSPFPSSPPSLSPLRSISPAAPSSKQPLPTQHKSDQPQHNLKPYIPIPTPFEYSDDDGDDFRGYFDFDRAWAGSDSDPNKTARQQLEGSQELAESPLPGLSSSPSSTSSGASCGTILTPKTPYQDQEYYDIMYKLDLGAESPYLGSAYAEAFGTRGCLLSQPPPPPPPSAKARARESTDSSSSSTNSNVDATIPRPSLSKHNTHCGICLRKAVSPCRTKCCDRMFCRAHISDWLRSKESSGLCPSCDTLCVLSSVADESSSKTVLRKRRGSTSLSPSHSRTPSASTSSASSSSSCLESGSSTRVGTRSNFSSSATLALAGTPTIDGETEDLWDVKSTWKKNGGGSLDFVEMVREVMGDVVSGSMKFVGLSGGVRPRVGARGHRLHVTQQVKQITTQPGTSDVERGFNFSPKELVKEVSGFTLGLGKLGGVTEVEEADEIGEAGVARRMVSIVALLFVLFVLFR